MYIYKSTKGLGGLSVFLNFFPSIFFFIYILFPPKFCSYRTFLYVLQARTSQRNQTAVRFAREDPQLGNRTWQYRVDQTTCWLLSSSFYLVQHTTPIPGLSVGGHTCLSLTFLP